MTSAQTGRTDSGRTALLVIDVQAAIDDPRWAHEGSRNNPQAEANIGALLRHWREHRWPVIHVRHESREPHSSYRPGQPGIEFKPAVAPRPGESIVTKHVPDAFVGTDLLDLLNARQPRWRIRSHPHERRGSATKLIPGALVRCGVGRTRICHVSGRNFRPAGELTSRRIATTWRGQ